jgi:hypothetical protein
MSGGGLGAEVAQSKCELVFLNIIYAISGPRPIPDPFFSEYLFRHHIFEGFPRPRGPARLQKRTQQNPAGLPSGTQPGTGLERIWRVLALGAASNKSRSRVDAVGSRASFGGLGTAGANPIKYIRPSGQKYTNTGQTRPQTGPKLTKHRPTTGPKPAQTQP